MGEIADALRRAHGQSQPPSRHGLAATEAAQRNAPAASSAILTSAAPERAPSSQPPAPGEDERGTSSSSGPPQSIQREGGEWGPARITLTDPNCATTQRFRRLAIRVRELADARQARSIVVTSAQPADGKTTTACNLAIELARLDRSLRIALIDLDLRRPSVGKALGLNMTTTIDAILSGNEPLARGILETDVPGLSVLAARSHVPNAEFILAHPNLRSTLLELERSFGFVIIDTPPLLAMPDAQLILRHASAALLVARGGRTPVDAVRRAFDLIPPGKLLGSFLNSSPRAHRAAEYSDQYIADPPDPDMQPAESESR